MLRRRILASAMASVMAIGSVAVVASADDAAAATTQSKTKADLEAYVKSFDAFRSDEIYTYGSISGENFLNAIEYADNVLADAESTVDDFTVAYAMIESVYNRLTIHNAEELKALVDSCKAIYETANINNEELGDLIYTTDSFAAFETAYEEAELALGSADSRIITDAYEALDAAKKGLSPNTVVTKSGFRTALKAYEQVLQKEFVYDAWRVGTINDTTWALWYANGDIVTYGALYQHVASLEKFINDGYDSMDAIKSLTKTTQDDIVNAYKACVNATLLFNSFEADDTDRASKANVKSLLKTYNGRLVYDFNRTTAEDLYNAIIDLMTNDKITVLQGDNYSSSFKASADVTDPWYTTSAQVSIKPNTQGKYKAKVRKLMSAELSIKSTEAFYIALDENGYAVDVKKTKADAEKVEVDVTYETGKLWGNTVEVWYDAKNDVKYGFNGDYLFELDGEGTGKNNCIGDASKIEELGLERIVVGVKYASSVKRINPKVAVDLTDYVPAVGEAGITDGDLHLWNNVIDGDKTDDAPVVPDNVSGVDGYGPNIIQIGGGNPWDTISPVPDEVWQGMDGTYGDYTTYADLAVAYDLAQAYINSKKGDDAILDIDSSGTLTPESVKGSSKEWSMVYRYLKYALADRYDASYDKYTRAQVVALIDDTYEMAELTGDAALFNANHMILTEARQDALDWVKAANKDKNYKDNVSFYDFQGEDCVSTEVYQTLESAYKALKKDYEAFKYSYEEIYNTISDVKADIDAGDLNGTDTLLSALDETAYRLSVVEPVVDGAGETVEDNEAYTSDRFFQGFNRVFTNGDAYDLLIDKKDGTKITVAQGNKDGGPNVSQHNLKVAYEALLAAVKEQTEPKYALGDVNKDGKVNALDAAEILKAVVAGTTDKLENADFDGNKAVNSLDASAILKASVNA